MPSLEIKSYSVRLTKCRDWKFSPDAKNLDFDEWIFCRGINNQTIRIFFIKGEVPKSFITREEHWYTFLHRDQYAYALDLLRNESPVMISVDTDNGRLNLYCGLEPVGEGPGEFT